MVVITLHLIIYGVRPCIGACGQRGGIGRAVSRIEQSAERGCSSGDERLSLARVGQRLCCWGSHGDVGLRNSKGGCSLAAVVRAVHGGDGHGGGASIRVVAIGHGVVGTEGQRGLAVLHGDGRLNGLARVALVGNGLNPSVLQVLRVRSHYPNISLGHGERPRAVGLVLGHGDFVQQTGGAATSRSCLPRGVGADGHVLGRVARFGCHADGHHVVIAGQCDRFAAHGKLHRAVSRLAHSQVERRSGIVFHFQFHVASGHRQCPLIGIGRWCHGHIIGTLCPCAHRADDGGEHYKKSFRSFHIYSDFYAILILQIEGRLVFCKTKGNTIDTYTIKLDSVRSNCSSSSDVRIVAR